jgi:putative transposase
MDESYFLTAARYVELNPVRARLVAKAEDYPWSSAVAHLSGRDDIVISYSSS